MLSQRTKTASHEVRELIENSRQHVEAGRKRVDQAGATTQEVIATIREVAMVVSEITDGSKAQARDIEQINSGFASMDENNEQKDRKNVVSGKRETVSVDKEGSRIN